MKEIAAELEKQGVVRRNGRSDWNRSNVNTILHNEKYVGDVLMQKTYTEDFLTGIRKKNNGERSMFFIKNDHEPIISREDFEAVQRRKNK